MQFGGVKSAMTMHPVFIMACGLVKDAKRSLREVFKVLPTTTLMLHDNIIMPEKYYIIPTAC